MAKRSGTMSQIVVVVLGFALIGCDDEVHSEDAFSAFEDASEARCDCYSSHGYGSKGSCLTDIDYTSRDQSAIECIDHLLDVYGQPAQVALECEADTARAYTRCIDKVNACGLSLLEQCAEEHDEELEDCPDYPTGFFADVSRCH